MKTNSRFKATDSILEECRVSGRYYPEDTGTNFPVSSHSCWSDNVWIFDGKTAGSPIRTVTANWNIVFTDGTCLLDDNHSVLLYQAKCLLWSIFVDRRNGRRLKTSNVDGIYVPLKYLIKWMRSNTYESFNELDNHAFERFIEQLGSPAYLLEKKNTKDFDVLDVFDTSNVSEEDSEDQISHLTLGAFYPYIRVWGYLWEQREALEQIGITTIKEFPFIKETALQISERLATKFVQSIPALPDQVAVAIMNAAHNFVDEASEDLQKIITVALATRKKVHSEIKDPYLRGKTISDTLANFEFKKTKFTGEPWRPPLGLTPLPALNELRVLLDDLVRACLIVIQSETGMRMNEVLSLKSGMDENTGLPSCITVRSSKSGMLDLFYLRSTLSKMRAVPTREEWLLAASPRFREPLPSAVRAVVVLQKTLEPFRELGSEDVRKSLVVTFSMPSSLPWNGSSISLPLTSTSLSGIRSFISRHVDWGSITDHVENFAYKQTRGECLVSHQWRKNYAQYVFQVDQRMIPAIARQFKHRSLAMTEGAYIGTNIALVQGIADHNRKLTVDLLLMNARGESPKQEGRLAKMIKEHQDSLAGMIKSLPDDEARAVIDVWCKQRDVKIFFHDYGKCIPAISPIDAECHKRANTVHWANKEPNFATREPSICTGCQLFLAGSDSISYWENRYRENHSAWLAAKSRGEEQNFRVSKARSEQSATYLKLLGADIPEVGPL